MGSMLPLVGAAAHIGPPAAVCKVVRRALAAKPPLGDQGEVAGRRPDGGDQSWQRPEAYNPSVSLREPAPFAQGSQPSQALGTQRWAGCLQRGGAVRAGIKPAPTPPAPGLPVGAACMAARNRLPIRAGVPGIRFRLPKAPRCRGDFSVKNKETPADFAILLTANGRSVII